MALRDEPPKHRPKVARGVVLPFVAVGAMVLVGAVALVVDLGRLMLVRAELQSAADACALSAVHELNQTVGQLRRAERAGKFAASQVPRGFQGLPSASISDAATTVSFSTNGSTFEPASSSAASHRFARCQVRHPGVGSLIGSAIDASVNGEIAATATATARPASRACVVPLALDIALAGTQGFQPNTVYYLARAVYRSTVLLKVGSIITLDLNPSSDLDLTTYRIRTVDLRASSGGAATASDAETYMAQVGAGVCDVDVSSGRANLPAPLWQNTSDVDRLWPHWNARFGLYRAGSALAPTTGTPGRGVLPDLTGWAREAVYTSTTSGGLLGLIGSTVTLQPGDEQPQFSAATTGRYRSEANIRSVTPVNARPFDYGPANAAGSASEAGNHATFGASGRRLAILPVVRSLSTSRADVTGYACTLLHRPIGLTSDQQLQSILNVLGIRLGNSSSRLRLSIAVEFLGMADEPGSPCRSGGMPGSASARGPLTPTLLQ